MLIEVSFKGNRKEFFLWPVEEPPPLKAAVIVEADRGEDLGYVHAIGELAEKRYAGVAHGAVAGSPPRPARRLASADDVRRARELRDQDEAARRRGMERVKANGLVMKLSDAEWQWDRKKLTFYFTAEKRVDFRNLVRDLAALFRARIELKQIGVRDEARLDGIGRCGRQYCSASWLPELRPVNLGVAKDQKLSLNPSQISGACGRLMCCLRYEHDFYVQSRKRFPKEGKIIVTAIGEEKVVANDIFNDRVTLRNVEGETRIVGLAQLRRELAGDVDAEPSEDELAAAAVETSDPELISLEDTAERPAFRPGMTPPQLPVTIQRRAATPRLNSSRPSPSAVAPAASPAASVPPVPSTEEPAPAAESGSAEEPRSPRRRRGRRGGRRGRGGPNAMGAAGGGVASDDTDNGPESGDGEV
jgi:cell fate regulator YaaT (PSP1 superfamily)